jgi:hypothetical protein
MPGNPAHVSTDPRHIYRALDALDALDLPFQLAQASLENDHVELHVASNEIEEAIAYFDEHPFTLANGTSMAVKVLGLAGGWISDPPAQWGGAPGPLSLDELVGLDVREAARRANECGWRVRTYEPEAPLTADNQPDRVNLCYSTDDVVTHADFG